MDFDKPKVYGDTSITDGLVYIFIDRGEEKKLFQQKNDLFDVH